MRQHHQSFLAPNGGIDKRRVEEATQRARARASRDFVARLFGNGRRR